MKPKFEEVEIKFEKISQVEERPESQFWLTDTVIIGGGKGK